MVLGGKTECGVTVRHLKKRGGQPSRLHRCGYASGVEVEILYACRIYIVSTFLKLGFKMYIQRDSILDVKN